MSAGYDFLQVLREDAHDNVKRAISELTPDTPPAQVDKVVDLIAAAGGTEADEDDLLHEVKARTRRNLGALRATLSSVKSTARRARNEREREKSGDERPSFGCPLPDAEFLPVIATLNEVLGAVTDPEPPMRDQGGFAAEVTVSAVPGLHALMSETANAQHVPELMPAPEHPLLSRMSDIEVAEQIERYVCFKDRDGRPVRLPRPFVRQFVRRQSDPALPRARGVTTLPLVRPDGKLLAPSGLDRPTGIVFRVPAQLLGLLPKSAPTAEDVRDAVSFLMDEWLADVLADDAGKATIIAIAGTIIERLALPERPGFAVTAAQRGGGKTTTLSMVATAVLGTRAPAAAWSPSEEERRKALFAYLLSGVPMVVWDNIPRGTVISCPAIERALTTETYADRVLGESRVPEVSASTVLAFTGNNVEFGGDLLSRVLPAHLEVDRPDPENREFKHADPISWTRERRGEILLAVYTILLGNPRFGRPAGEAETRFKMWWHLVGSAIESASRLRGTELSFAELFLRQEESSEEASAAGKLLRLLRENWPGAFTGSEVAQVINQNPDTDPMRDQTAALRDAIEAACRPRWRPGERVSAQSVTSALKRMNGSPVDVGRDDGPLIVKLKFTTGHSGGFFDVVQAADGKPWAPAAPWSHGPASEGWGDVTGPPSASEGWAR